MGGAADLGQITEDNLDNSTQPNYCFAFDENTFDSTSDLNKMALGHTLLLLDFLGTVCLKMTKGMGECADHPSLWALQRDFI